MEVSGTFSAWSTQTTSFEAPAPTAVVAAGGSRLSTLGSELITITGSSFGPIGTQVSAVYGPYTTSGCSVTVADATIVCTSAAGIGFDHVLTLSVGAPAQISTALRVSYRLPVVSGVSPSVVSSDAGENIAISGAFFGPPGSVVHATMRHATYGTCNLTYVSHTDSASSAVATFTSCTGFVGAGYNLTITVGGQVSEADNELLSYSPPTVSSATMAGNKSTAGNLDLTVVGTQFGNNIGFVTVFYGTYQATNCAFESGAIKCRTSPGVGSSLQVRVTAGEQSSTPSDSVTVSYASPTVSSVSPNELLTNGSTVITVSGSNFGRSGDTRALVYGPSSSPGKYSGTCTVVADDTILHCSTESGIGTEFTYNYTVGSQSGTLFSADFAYNYPSIHSFTPAGPFGTSDTTTLTVPSLSKKK